MGRNPKGALPAEETPLHDAARNGNVEEITRLLALTPALLNSRDRHSRTPLHMAAWAGQTEAVKLLCDRKADIKAAAGDDMAAIHFASQKGHLEAVRVLLAAKAEANSLTRKGLTPLHMAVQGGHKDVCTLLIKKGANLLTKNKAGKTPVDLAKDESLGSCLKAAEAERRALIDSKKKSQTKESSEDQVDDKQETEAGGSDSAAQAEAIGPVENVGSTTGVKRESSSLSETVVEGEQKEERSASKERRKKSKVSLSHLDTEEAE
ncbi:hypothetical protein M758_5G110700 [Ceratodon purpureus]|nr:hypothetical protein M758_5G110700 [Ceratodon purpureus]